MNDKIPLQCGHRIEAGGDIWQVESISTTGQIATMKKVEPEVPEAIKDLLEGPEKLGISVREANWRVIEAYRRGQQSK